MTSVLMFFIIDFGIYFTFKEKLEREQTNEELLSAVEEIQKASKEIMTKDEAAKLKQIDLSEIIEPTKRGFKTEGNIIGKYMDEPIYELLRDISNEEVLHYVGALTGSDIDAVIQKMMLANDFAKIVRLENGLIYAIKKEA